MKDIWAGSYNTVARAEDDQMMVMGLNNYAQLALPTTKALTFFMPQLSKKMTELAWNCVAIGQHHVIGVEQSGQVSHPQWSTSAKLRAFYFHNSGDCSQICWAKGMNFLFFA